MANGYDARRHRCGAIPTSAWRDLEGLLLRDGIRDAVVVAFPPTGIVSELLGVSKSYEPHFELQVRGGGLRPEVALAIELGEHIGPDGQIV